MQQCMLTAHHAWATSTYKRQLPLKKQLKGSKPSKSMQKTEESPIKDHAEDNGIFRANKWKAKCTKHGQTLIFAGVNANHTNGKAEKRIRDLQDTRRPQQVERLRNSPPMAICNKDGK